MRHNAWGKWRNPGRRPHSALDTAAAHIIKSLRLTTAQKAAGVLVFQTMYYELAQIDNGPLPQPVDIHGRLYRVTRGGLLLEPPGAPDVPRPDGHSILKFFGVWPTGEEGFVAASMEPYRSLDDTRIEISRRESDRGARFSGTADERGARLTMLDGSRFLPLGTVLAFVASPDEPINADWMDTFDFGPPHTEIVNPELRDNPEMQARVRQWIAEREPERHASARTRLERAWRAPPV